jgi:hypothetical protein
MAAFLFSFPACVLAALALDRVTTASSWMYIFWAGVTPDKLQALEAALPWLSRGALLFLSTQNRIRAGALLLVLALLTIADTWRIDHLFLQYEQPADSPDLRTTNPGTKAFLEQQPRRFRVLPLPDYRWLSHPRYHVPGVDGVTGFNNYTLRRYELRLQKIRPLTAYYETRFSGGTIPYPDDQIMGALQPYLDLVSARFVAAPIEVELRAADFPQVYAEEHVRINADRSGDSVELSSYDNHEGVVEIDVRASAPRLLVLNDNFHPHWRATVEGIETAIL